MKKVYLLASIFIFLFATILVLLFDSSINKKVAVSFSDAEFKNSSKAFVNKKINAELQGGNINSQDINASLQDINAQGQDINFEGSNSNIKNTQADFQNKNNAANIQGGFYNQHQRISSYGSIEDGKVVVKPTPAQNSRYYNTIDINDMNLSQDDINKIKQTGQFDDLNHLSQKDLKLIEEILNRSEIPQEEDVFEDIDWDTYKLRLISKVAEDSSYLKALDGYPVDTPVYYSFKVDLNGNISNIIIISVLREYDKKQFAQLIQNLQHKPILKFPKNTNRKKVTIQAILLLTDEERGDAEIIDNKMRMKDIERVKLN